MKISIGNYYIDKYGTEDGAKRMVRDGYTYCDLQFSDTESIYYTAREEDFLELCYGLKKALKKEGIEVLQIHGPWQYPPMDGGEDERAERFGKMTKAMVIAKHLGAKYMAVHPLMPYGANSPEDPEGVYAINKRYYEALAKVAGGLGVVICLENMPFVSFPLSGCEEILRLVREINSPNLKMCFDTGHANILGEDIYDCLRVCADEVRILHIHDNNALFDQHLPPYEGNVDWSVLAEGLYDIGFDGAFNLETEPTKYFSGTDEEKEKRLAEVARLIAG